MSPSLLVEQSAHADKIVLKRLKFVVKILSALVREVRNGNRQVHVHIFEVLDSISDWSGNYDEELVDFINKQVFPLICRIVATLNRQEFDSFQSFICRYLLKKWPETENFIALELLSDVYGFIASIAPAPVVVELVEVFQQEEMPPYVSLIVLPAIVSNVPAKVPCNFLDKITRSFLRADYNSPNFFKSLSKYWETLPSKIEKFRNVHQMKAILRQCTVVSFYLNQLEEAFVIEIIQNWTKQKPNSPNTEGYLLAGVLFVHSICCNTDKPLPEGLQSQIESLMQCILEHTETCGNLQIRKYTTNVMQRILEYVPESESLRAFIQQLQMDDEETSFNEADTLINTIESSIQQISSEALPISEPVRRRITSMIDSLQTLLENNT